MYILIDTNAYLSFYHLSSDDLEELKKLAVLAREEKITLLLPEQVVDEFQRNRAGKIADALKRMRDQRKSIQLPQIARQYKEYEVMRKAHAEYEKQLATLIEKIEGDVTGGNLEADAVIEELFQAARRIPMSSGLIASAQLRMELGRPPGKKGSLGDAINWETLSQVVPSGEDLYLVSDDGDFASPLDEARFDPYLQDEWQKAKHSQIHFYKRLSALFRENFPDIELATELEKDLLIRELLGSPNFLSTHAIIAKLSKFSDFSRDQLNELAVAAITNDQVFKNFSAMLMY
jgi:hypothetical protein